MIRFYNTANVQKGGRRFDMFPFLDPKITESILRIVQDRRIVGIWGMGGLLWTSTWVFNSLGSALNIRDGLGNLDNMEQFLSDKLPGFMPLPGS